MVEEIEGLVDLLFVGGLYTIQKDVIVKLNKIADESIDFGLEYGSKIISRITEELQKKRHTMDYDYLTLTDDFCKLSLYITSLKNRIHFKRIEELLKV